MIKWTKVRGSNPNLVSTPGAARLVTTPGLLGPSVSLHHPKFPVQDCRYPISDVEIHRHLESSGTIPLYVLKMRVHLKLPYTGQHASVLISEGLESTVSSTTGTYNHNWPVTQTIDENHAKWNGLAYTHTHTTGVSTRRRIIHTWWMIQDVDTRCRVTQ